VLLRQKCPNLPQEPTEETQQILASTSMKLEEQVAALKQGSTETHGMLEGSLLKPKILYETERRKKSTLFSRGGGHFQSSFFSHKKKNFRLNFDKYSQKRTHYFSQRFKFNTYFEIDSKGFWKENCWSQNPRPTWIDDEIMMSKTNSNKIIHFVKSK